MLDSMQLKYMYDSTLPYGARCLIYQQTKLKYYQSNMHTPGGDALLKSFYAKGSIFIHVPKTGGISMKKSLYGYSALPHLSAEDYRIIYGKRDYDKFFKFAFVRNPWDRLLSAFNFLKAGGCTPRDKAWAEANLSQYDTFEDFVCNWVTRKSVHSHVHFIPQYRFICNRNRVPMIDFIGRFEKIAEDFEAIRSKINADQELKFLNRSSKKKVNYQDCYSEKTKEIVANVYSHDIELFDYSF